MKLKAVYSHRIHLGSFVVYKRFIGPYLVATSVDHMGRATSTIWVKEGT